MKSQREILTERERERGMKSQREILTERQRERKTEGCGGNRES